MMVLRTKRMLCLSCMEVHDVKTVMLFEENIYKGKKVSYPAVYNYCDRSDETYADEQMISTNNSVMKAVFRADEGTDHE